jgi:chromosome segregation ATPase
MAMRIELETQQRHASLQAEIDSLRLKIAQIIDRINQLMDHLHDLIDKIDSNRGMTLDQIKEQEPMVEVVMLQIEKLLERLEGRLAFLLAQLASRDSHSRTR